ncbi:predicted protein [Thalassiosira pseudonana CCMP1335]|uniref:OTU domain-containing protein n=1 Tax=Thalassiosira pseudonana TaxID=35128 RepID=B8C8S4_THAPS|nr:predicted protein [Thalassiosira pseudonana CCMP1335]EED89926.1 predicted protein [Thalassiosira pseudonana CCMP1335]
MKRRRRSNKPSPSSLSSFVANLAILSCLLSLRQQSSSNFVAGEGSTIPRSTNRYSNYPSPSDSINDDIINDSNNNNNNNNSVLNNGGTSNDYHHPPWNPSPKINSSGFLSHLYPRLPGEWEPLANIRGKHGPRSRTYPKSLVDIPVEIRQVPGDGNCLFHSIAVCLYKVVNGTHISMDSPRSIHQLRCQSLHLRNCAVDVLQNVPRKRLFLQGEEYLEANELLGAAAAQFELDGEEYCELMRKESYWGGGPEIVALCNYLQRPIHIYELIPTQQKTTDDEQSQQQQQSQPEHAQPTSTQFTLRRMACFGSPKYDRREPLHILSADSRFPDIEPRKIRKVGNHFLALFPVTTSAAKLIGESEEKRGFRRHALIRGGQSNNNNNRRGDSESTRNRGSSMKEDTAVGDSSVRNERGRLGRWDGGLGSWTNKVMDWFAVEDGSEYFVSHQQRNGEGKMQRLMALLFTKVVSITSSRGFS